MTAGTLRCALLSMVMLAMASMQAYAKRPRYIFELPNKYVGWVQIIFNDPNSPSLPIVDGGVLLEVPESGIVRTSNLRIHASLAPDEFYYRKTEAAAEKKIIPIPSEDVLSGPDHGGFGVMDTGGRGKGYSWFVFIGPPQERRIVPFADWSAAVKNWRELHGNSRVVAPDPYPMPGRIMPKN